MNQNTNYKLRDFLSPSMAEILIMTLETPVSLPLAWALPKDHWTALTLGTACAFIPHAVTYVGFRLYELFGKNEQIKNSIRNTKFNKLVSDKTHSNYCPCNDCKAVVESELELKAKTETVKVDESQKFDTETVKKPRELGSSGTKKTEIFLVPEIIFDEQDESKTKLKSPYFTE